MTRYALAAVLALVAAFGAVAIDVRSSSPSSVVAHGKGFDWDPIHVR